MLFMNYALSFNPQDGKEVFDKACLTQKLIKCRDPDSSIYSIFHINQRKITFSSTFLINFSNSNLLPLCNQYNELKRYGVIILAWWRNIVLNQCNISVDVYEQMTHHRIKWELLHAIVQCRMINTLGWDVRSQNKYVMLYALSLYMISQSPILSKIH